MIKHIKGFLRNRFPAFFNILKKAKEPIRPFLYRLKFGKHGYDTLISKMGYTWRKHCPNIASKYYRIKSLKDIHKGKRCFIISTGPSLTVEDLEKLKSEITISMNSIINIFDSTEWRPTYYVIQDTGVAHDIMENGYDIWKIPSKIIINHLMDERFIHPRNVYMYRLDMNGHNVTHSTDEIEFSQNAFERVCDGYTVTYSCLQLAMYMGFSEIYLIGCDCNFMGNDSHAFGYKMGTESNTLKTADDKVMAAERMKAAYKIAKIEASKRGVKIYNSTRGGKLEVFERVNFDSLFLY